MKGLEEAGRVLLMQHGCIRGGSSGGGAGGDTEGTDADGAESGAEMRGWCWGKQDLAARGAKPGAGRPYIFEIVELGISRHSEGLDDLPR